MQHMSHHRYSQLATASLRSYMMILIMIVFADIAFCPIRSSFLVSDSSFDTRGHSTMQSEAFFICVLYDIDYEL